MSGIPPKRETGGFLTLSRCTVTWKQVRRPSGVSRDALYLRATLVAVDLCFPVRVLSIEVSIFVHDDPVAQEYQMAGGSHMKVRAQDPNPVNAPHRFVGWPGIDESE